MVFEVRLVENGKIKALRYELGDLQIETPTSCDGKWRVVVFDIPDKKKVTREVLRAKLRHLGFFKLQENVFIHPYECRKEIEIIKEAFEIWPYVNFMVVEEIDQLEELKEKFQL